MAFPSRILLVTSCLAAYLMMLPIGWTQTSDCSYDRESLLALNQDAFDQDMKGGWRTLAARGCIEEAADIIRDYRNRHQPLKGTEQSILLYWHEGQMRAMLGQDKDAIDLFGNTLQVGNGSAQWNFYVDATVAFLRRDRTTLLMARDALAKSGDSPNLTIVDNLVTCFGKSYRESYQGCK
jgi:hypothetical protein